MQRVSGANYLANGNGAGKNAYQDYNPATGQAGTTPNAAAFNALQEEIAGFIEAQGLALNANDNTQLAQAIHSYVMNALGGYETAAAATAALAAAVASLDSPAAVASAISAALATYAPLASPAFTGGPTAPTPGAGDNSTKLATTAFVAAALAASVAANPSIGTGQTWQNPARAAGNVYTNTTGRPILVSVWAGSTGGGSTVTCLVGGVTVGGQTSNYSTATTTFVVPAGATYEVTLSGGAITTWAELR